MKNRMCKRALTPTYRQFNRVSGFHIWLDKKKQSLTEEEANLSSGELIKVAMKEWKSLDDEQKAEWNSKAKLESTEQDEKKRKREKYDSENENKDKSTAVNKQAKKLKSAPVNNETGSTVSKLAGFAYKKSWEICFRTEFDFCDHTPYHNRTAILSPGFSFDTIYVVWTSG